VFFRNVSIRIYLLFSSIYLKEHFVTIDFSFLHEIKKICVHKYFFNFSVIAIIPIFNKFIYEIM